MNQSLHNSHLAQVALPHVARALTHHTMAQQPYRLRLEGEDADLPVPPEALSLFADILRAMAQGQNVRVITADQLLTTQQAADILFVSRTHLLKLISGGALSASKTGTHRRLILKDVLAFKSQRNKQRHTALQMMADADRNLGIDDL